MSIAQGAKLAELEKHMLALSRDLTDALAKLKEVQQRLEAIEQRPKPGRPPKEQ